MDSETVKKRSFIQALIGLLVGTNAHGLTVSKPPCTRPMIHRGNGVQSTKTVTVGARSYISIGTEMPIPDFDRAAGTFQSFRVMSDDEAYSMKVVSVRRCNDGPVMYWIYELEGVRVV